MNQNCDGEIKNKTNGSQELLKAADIARILNISKSFAYQLMNRNELRSVHIGNTRRVRFSDLEKFIELNTQGW